MTEDEMESEGEDEPAPAPADGAVQLLHYDAFMQCVNVTSGAVALT
jgi:hypothetical protein